MVDQIFSAIVRPQNNRIMPRSKDPVRNRSQHSGTRFISGSHVGAHHGVSDGIIHSVGFVFPAAGAEKAILSAGMVANAGPFDGVFFPIHFSIARVEGRQ